MSSTINSFPPGTFAPNPQRASVTTMTLAQAKLEASLFLRHGEQQLLSLVIPIIMMVALVKLPLMDLDNPIQVVFPLTLAIAAMSAGFTGQAIAVAFDRRYGALKRIGASGVPPWTIITGKALAVVFVVAVQTLILGAIGLALGWRAPLSHVLLAIVVLFLGVAAFTALGLLVGGTLGSELVLALANLIWFVFVGVASFAVVRSGGDIPSWLNVVPSVALADGLTEAFSGSTPLLHVAILIAWFLGAAAAATKLFKFTA